MAALQASSRRIASTIAIRRTTVLARSCPVAGIRCLSTASHSSSSSSYSRFTSSRTPIYTLGLVGTLGAWFGLNDGDKKDDKNVAGGALKHNKKVDYDAVYRDIVAVLEDENYDDGSYGPTLVRLAWHCSGTYDKNSGNGGSNGATMRFAAEANHGANAGLKVVRDLLEPIQKKHPGLSFSDLWTLAGVVAIQEMGGPSIKWRPGRLDAEAENCTPDGRLPDGDKGSDHLRKIFYKMGMDDREIVALSGAHALGRCHTDRSGFDGPWTYSPISFTNEYYKLLFNEKWAERKWNGPPQYENVKGKDLMMLRTDMALTTDPKFKPIAKQYAENEEIFFRDFSQAFAKLLELGVPKENFTAEPMILGVEEQK